MASEAQPEGPPEAPPEAPPEEASEGDAWALPGSLQADKDAILAGLRVSGEELDRLLQTPQRCADGCAHPTWLDGRRNRVTASRFASACGVLGARASPETVVEQMMALPEGRPGQAGRFGVQHEPEAREAYAEHLRGRCPAGLCRRGAAAPGPELEVHEVGL